MVTILTRLPSKGAMTRERTGRSFVWTPTADRADLAALRMRKVLDGVQDRQAVPASFVTGLLPQGEQMLRRLLDEAAEAEE